MRLPFAPPNHHATTAAAAAGRSWTAAVVAATLLFSPVQDLGLLPAPFAPGAAQAKELGTTIKELSPEELLELAKEPKLRRADHRAVLIRDGGNDPCDDKR